MVFVPLPTDQPHIPAPVLPLTEELRINRLNTDVFIAQDPIVLTLLYSPRRRTPGGAFAREAAAPRVPQTFKLVQVSPSGASIVQDGEDGMERRVDYILIGSWDAQIATGDYWNDARGNRWEVLSILPTNGYEVRANVTAVGDALTGG